MSFAEIFQAVSTVCAIIAAVCAIVAAVRAGRWRESDAAKALLGRVGSVETTVGLHGQRIQAIEEEIDQLPTKADIARLEGTINTTCAIAERTESAVIRLQGYLLEAKP